MDLRFELLLGILQNASSAAGFLCFLSGFATVIAVIAYVAAKSTATGNGSDAAEAKAIAPIIRWAMYGCLVTFIVSFIVSLIPTTDQMFKIRLNLIKFQLASPENVKKGTDEILDVAKKLECRYLGCPDEAKKEEKK